jgi:NADP-dependent 3-hydroxy acid dehydrogenase YdfG
MAVFVITGASSGVGRSCALFFAQKGNTVCVLARRTDALQQLEHENPDSIFAYGCDITDKHQVWQTFAAIEKHHKSIDVLINNAGVVNSPDDPWDGATVDSIIDTNLKGTMYCTYAALPSMQNQKQGSIFNVAYIAGVDISESGNSGMYAASKYGVVAFGDSLGRAVRKDGILITTLCPGGINTPLWNEENPYPFDKDEMIRPEEIADLIDYVLRQPRRTIFKNIIFVPTVEKW